MSKVSNPGFTLEAPPSIKGMSPHRLTQLEFTLIRPEKIELRKVRSWREDLPRQTKKAQTTGTHFDPIRENQNQKS